MKELGFPTPPPLLSGIIIWLGIDSRTDILVFFGKSFPGGVGDCSC